MGGGSFTNVEEFHPKYHNIEKYAFSNGRIAYCSLLTGKKPSTVARLTPPMITWLFISLKIKWWPFWTSHLSHSCIIKVCLGQDLSQKRQMPPTILSQSQTTVLISILVLLDKLTQHRFLTIQQFKFKFPMFLCLRWFFPVCSHGVPQGSVLGIDTFYLKRASLGNVTKKQCINLYFHADETQTHNQNTHISWLNYKNIWRHNEFDDL